MKKRVSFRAILKLEQTGYTEISLSIIPAVKALRTVFFFFFFNMFLSFCYEVRKKRHGQLLDKVGIKVKFIF